MGLDHSEHEQGLIYIIINKTISLAVHYTVTKHDKHLRTRGKIASVFDIS